MITIALWYLLIGGIVAHFTNRYTTKVMLTLGETCMLIAFWPIILILVLLGIEVSIED